MDAGSIAEWVAAAATLGALAAAVVAGITAKRVLQVEVDRDRRGDAKQIAVWAACELPDPIARPTSWGLVVHNASNSVVYDVEVDSMFFGEPTSLPKIQVLPPGDFYFSRNRATGSWSFAQSCAAIGHEIRPLTKPSESTKKTGITSLRFRDSADQRWFRTEGGELRAD